MVYVSKTRTYLLLIISTVLKNEKPGYQQENAVINMPCELDQKPGIQLMIIKIKVPVYRSI